MDSVKSDGNIIHRIICSVTKQIKKGQGFALPLLLFLVLPFYQLPGAEPSMNNPIMRVAQLQWFQLMTVLSFCLTFQKYKGSSYFCPFRWLVVLALSQLIWASAFPGMLSQISTLILAFVFFEVCVRSRISFHAFRWSILFLFLVTLIYSVRQQFDIRGIWFLPDYLVSDRSRIGGDVIVSGIWIVQAFCASFIAICVPLFWTWETRSKLFRALLLIACFALLWITNSSFARVAALLGILWVLLIRYPKRFLLYLVPVMLGGLLWCFYFDLGDLSSVVQRQAIWDATWNASLSRPILGHGFGYFFTFGAVTSMTQIGYMNSFYGQAHNELLQLFFEAGSIGVLIGLWIILRIVWIAFKHKSDSMICGLSACLITAICVSMGQPIFHTVNIAVLSVMLYGLFESRYNQLNEVKYADSLQWAATEKSS